MYYTSHDIYMETSNCIARAPGGVIDLDTNKQYTKYGNALHTDG